MRQPLKQPAGRLPQIDLVATRTPDGKIVHTELGVIQDPAKGLARNVQKLVEGVSGEIEYVRAEDVGLEWHTHNGKKLPQSDDWASEVYVAVTNAFGDEECGKHGQILTRRGIAKELRRNNHRLKQSIPEGELDEWLSHLESCHDLWERLKRGIF